MRCARCGKPIRFGQPGMTMFAPTGDKYHQECWIEKSREAGKLLLTREDFERC